MCECIFVFLDTTSDEDNSCSSFEHSSFFLENMVIVPTSPNHESISSHKLSLDSHIHRMDSSKPKKPKRPQTFYYDDSPWIDSESMNKLSEGISTVCYLNTLIFSTSRFTACAALLRKLRLIQ